MRIKFPLSLTKLITGQEIIDAVKMITDRDGEVEFHKEFVLHGERGAYYLVGQESKYPYNDLAIWVGGWDVKILSNGMKSHSRGKDPWRTLPRINKDKLYGELFVCPHEYRGTKFSVGFSNEKILKSLENFRDKLAEILKP